MSKRKHKRRGHFERKDQPRTRTANEDQEKREAAKHAALQRQVERQRNPYVWQGNTLIHRGDGHIVGYWRDHRLVPA